MPSWPSWLRPQHHRVASVLIPQVNCAPSDGLICFHSPVGVKVGVGVGTSVGPGVGIGVAGGVGTGVGDTGRGHHELVTFMMLVAAERT